MAKDSKKKIELPQEIEVWMIIPCIKREMARILINDFRYKQNEAADKIEITPAAVSQYLSGKRGGDIKFSKPAKELIRQSVKNIVEKKSHISYEVINLLKKDEIKIIKCKIHQKIDPRFRNCSEIPKV